MKIITAELVTRREVLVGVPDGVETVMQNGQIYIVEPGSGVTSPRILLSPTAALNQGLLQQVEEQKP